MNININAVNDDRRCNTQRRSPPPRVIPSLVTLPRLHPLRLHVACDEAILASIASPLVRGSELSSRQLRPALITDHPQCSDSTPAH